MICGTRLKLNSMLLRVMTLAMGSNVATLSHLLQFGKLVTFKYCVKGLNLKRNIQLGDVG